MHDIYQVYIICTKYTSYTQSIHHIQQVCIIYIIYTSYTHHIHHVHIIYIKNTSYTHHIHQVHIIYTRYTSYTHHIHQVYIIYTKYTSYTPTIHHIHQVYIIYTKYTSYTPSIHQVYIIYTKYASYIPSIHHIHQVYMILYHGESQIRRLLKLPRQTHCALLHLICDDIHVSYQMYSRCLKFFKSVFNSDNSIVKYCAKLAMSGSRSVMSNNLSVLSKVMKCTRYDLSLRVLMFCILIRNPI